MGKLYTRYRNEGWIIGTIPRIYEEVGKTSQGDVVLSFEYNDPKNPKYAAMVVDSATFFADFKEYWVCNRGSLLNF